MTEEEQQQQRQRCIALHIRLLEHAAQCVSQTCPSNNCLRMKNYLDHTRLCSVKASGGVCRICRRVVTLLRLHAVTCRQRQCLVPKCRAIRANMRP